MTEMQTQIVTLTDSAAREIVSLRENDKIPSDKYLRIGVKGGGCSGLSYILEFEEKTDKDEIYILNGVEVVVDSKQAMYLVGIEVDFERGLNDRGFVFNNPNAKSTCGCGTSFST
ncbi:iron-sulfur cluster assembly accessory protein [bacterium]|nr:iron-sulfur cluster assembly accessory protein [bacterium]